MEKKIFLSEKDMPRAWYNIQADLPNPLPPPLNPDTGEPITPDMLEPIFPMNLIEQEVSTERWIDIPEEVMERLLMYRPSPSAGPIPWRGSSGRPPTSTSRMKA